MAENLTTDNVINISTLETTTPDAQDKIFFIKHDELTPETAVKASTVNDIVVPIIERDIKPLIPNTATAENQLADKDFVNSTVGTNTAIFRGTFNSVEELNAYSGDKTNNDYAFVIDTDSAGNTLYNRYKYNGTAWVYEYSLNNSSFTAEQWAAINSGITASLIAELQRLTIQGTFDAVHPIGEYYVQYPTIVDVDGTRRATKDPNKLYNVGGIQSTWTELDFDGAFFRSNGGLAKTFGGGKQADEIKRHNHSAMYHGTNSGTIDYTGLYFLAYKNPNSVSYQDFMYTTGGDETRPVNYTVKIWIRTA